MTEVQSSRAPLGLKDLAVGCWSFTATADSAANAGCIRRGIRAARGAGMRVLLTPECALIGYPGAARPDLADVDWCRLGDLEDTLLTEAAQAGITLVLGTAGPVGGGSPQGFANEAVTTAGRYRKRRLMPGDAAHFIAGDVPLVIDVDGWRCGLGICYDLRFAPVWHDLARAGADAFLVLGHMAGVDAEPGVKATVVPQFCAVRAGEWATPLVFCNTAAPDRWLGSGAWDARGIQTHRADAPGEHLLTAAIRPRNAFPPWYAGIRAAALSS